MVSESRLRRIINGIGIEVFTLKKLPFGINPLHDAVRKSKLKDPEIIFDVGANVGQTSTYLRKAFSKSAIYAFEPVSSTFEEMMKNLSDKGVKGYNIGFGEKAEKRNVFLQDKSGLNSLVDTLNKPIGSGINEEVEISTIDNFCEEQGIKKISILKIDTEGFGLKVLAGSDRMLSTGCIESIFIEVGFDEGDKRHDNFCDVSKVLNWYSFGLLGFYDQWIEKSKLEYCNAFFVLRKL